MNEMAFNRWLLHTSRDWDDIKDVIKKTYIPVIDNDHKQLARYALDLNLIFEKIQKKEITLSVLKEEKKTLKQFQQYAKEHFSREEKLISYFLLGDFDEQSDEHQRTLGKLEELVQNLEKGKIIFTQDNKTELLEWIIEHTNGLDSKTFNINSFEFFFNKMKSFDQMKLFLNFTGIPEVDFAIEEFFGQLVTLLDGERESVEREVLVQYNKLIKVILAQNEERNLNLKGELVAQFETFRPFQGIDLKSKYIKGKVLTRFLKFNAKEVCERLEISQWLPLRLINVKKYDEISSLIKMTEVDEIDESLRKLLVLTFESFDIYSSGDAVKSKAKISELAISINQHFINIEKSSKNAAASFKKYYTENFKRLRIYLDKAFLHILNDRLEYSISLRNKIIFHCLYQNNFNDYAAFKLRALSLLDGEGE